MVTTLYLIRHGETEGSETKRYKGSLDVPLSENGLEQAKKTSDFLVAHLKSSHSSKYLSYLKDIHGKDPYLPSPDSGRLLAAVYCSHLSRAVKSAEIISEPYGLEPIIVDDLRERGFGVWEGMAFNEIREKYPREFEAWASNPLKYSPMGGESTLEVRDRAVGALDRILSDHQGENIAIVAHGGVNRVILCHVMGIPLENVFRIEQDFAAVNIIEFWEKYPVVKLLNGGPHV